MYGAPPQPQQIFPPAAGDPRWGCDPYPDGNVVGPIVAPAIYWTDQYKAIKNPKQGLHDGNEFAFLLDPDGSQRGCRSYWHVSCFGLEKLMPTDEAEALYEGRATPTQQLSGLRGGHPSSSLKVVLEWPTAHQEKQMLIADIGTGFDIKIGPSTHVTGVLLVPDPPPGIVIPPALAPLEDLSTATLVTARATPMNVQGGTFNGRYTQTLITTAGGPATLHEIPRFARWVQIYTGAPTLADPPVALPPAAVTACWIYDILPGGGGLAPLGCIGSFGAGPLGPLVSSRIPIPQNASHISLSSAGVSLVTLVYGLSL